jgi:Kef-type K+ transport system membrane component KefB
MINGLVIDVAVFALFPFMVWRMTGRVVPLAVLPLAVGLSLSVLGARVGTGTLLTPSATGDMLGWAGVLALAYCAGLEARLPSCPMAGHAPAGRVFATALTALALPFAAGVAIVLSGVFTALRAPAGAPPWFGAMAVGLCFAVSALPVLICIVRELPPRDRALGHLAMRIAIIDDIMLWIGLGGLLMAWRADHTLGQWGMSDVVAVSMWVGLVWADWKADRAHVKVPQPIAWVAGAALLMAGAWSTSTLGLHALLGAYFAGLLTPALIAEHLPVERLAFAALALFAPIFFGHRGLAINGVVLDWTALATSVALLVLSATAKILATLVAPPLPDLSRRKALQLGCLLQCKGLMEIVAATILQDEGLLNQSAYAVLVSLALLSTVLTMPLFRCAGARHVQNNVQTLLSGITSATDSHGRRRRRLDRKTPVLESLTGRGKQQK